MRKNKAVEIPQIKTLEEADAHQRKHGFAPLISSRERQLDRVHGAVDLNERKAKKLRGDVREVKMNVTEREFAVMLAAQRGRNEIQAYCFQGIRLAWGDCMVYKPDFSVLQPSGRGKVIEVKGAFIRDRDIVRFKGCRAEWKDWFDFEMWQRDENKRWNQIL